MLKLLFVVIALTTSTTLSEREHKVHNIILYPEKHSWCTTTPIQQVVAYPGYEPVTIDNNICVGACYSYSIPSTQPAEPGELIGPYCDSCQPAESKCYHVTLKADSKNAEGPRTFQKRVQIIMNCSCMSCEKYKREDCEISTQNTIELPQDLFSNKTQDNQKSKVVEEVPELLHFKPDRNRLHFNLDVKKITSHDQKYDLNSKLITLLKSIQNEDDNSEETNLSYDKAQLKELLNIIEGSENELSDQNLMQFVNFVNIHNSEDLELDLSKLKQVLTQFQKDQILEKHSKKAAHHHIGDEVQVDGINLGHLVKGPHGSMVISPDLKVEEKLNIDSDILKPNHDGVVIAYENDNLKKN